LRWQRHSNFQQRFSPLAQLHESRSETSLARFLLKLRFTSRDENARGAEAIRFNARNVRHRESFPARKALNVNQLALHQLFPFMPAPSSHELGKLGIFWVYLRGESIRTRICIEGVFWLV
jgi:hypothetical protein